MPGLRPARCWAWLLLLAAASAAAAPALELSKAEQRRLGLRTLTLAETQDWLELPALVQADPRQQLWVAAPQAGQLRPPPGGYPLAGSPVRTGQLLAWLQPALGQAEQRDLESELSLAERDAAIGQLQLQRYGINDVQHFEVKLPTPSIQIVTEYRSAVASAEQLRSALRQPLELRAPRDGTLLRGLTAAGPMVVAGQALFELQAREQTVVSCEYSDEGLDPREVREGRSLDGTLLPLRLLTVSLDARRRSQRALYALAPGVAAPAVNTPLRLRLPRHRPWTARLPPTAVFGHQGADWVWLHAGPERFQARRLDATLPADARLVLNVARLPRPGPAP